MAEVLKREGYIWDFEEVGDEPQRQLRLHLKYGPNGERVIRFIKRISTPGRRVYSAAHELRPGQEVERVRPIEDLFEVSIFPQESW